MDLLGELAGLLGEGRDTLHDLARDDIVLVLDKLLKLGDIKVSLGALGLLDLVAASLDDGSVVVATSTVPGEEVGGALGHVGEGILSGDLEKVVLELLGGDGSKRVLRVGGGLERKVVGQETSDMGRGHGSAGDGVGGVLAADPGGKNAETGGEDISALAVVGEVGTAVINARGTDRDGLGSSSWRVVAGISVVVAGGDGEVNADRDGGVHSVIESLGLATTKRHVGDGALEALALAILGLLDGLDVRLGSPLHTGDDIRHGAGAVRAKDLDGIDVGLLGDTILLAGDGAGAVSAVAIAIDIGIAGGDGLAPLGTAIEIDVVDVGASVNNVGINTLTTLSGVQVLVEGGEAQSITVRDTSQTPRGGLLNLAVALGILNHTHGVDNAITLDVLDLFANLLVIVERKLEHGGKAYIRVPPDLLDGLLIEVASITKELGADLVGMLQAVEDIVNQRELTTLLEVYPLVLTSGVELLDPSVVIRHLLLSYVLLELDNVGIWDDLGVGRGKNGRSLAMDGFNRSTWCRGSSGRERENGVALHDCGQLWG